MTARSTYESSVKAAGPVAVQSLTNASVAAQETISLLGAAPSGGTSLAFGVSAANDAKIRTANVALQVAQQAAQVAKQASEDAAKVTLRATGDLNPF